MAGIRTASRPPGVTFILAENADCVAASCTGLSIWAPPGKRTSIQVEGDTGRGGDATMADMRRPPSIDRGLLVPSASGTATGPVGSVG